ncbi:ABC transporter ATP-binding protein [Brochothrix thermosphacta]|uniref:ABC transporter ATP-binding protein n=3 Tax=Brochothrix thermosphacta TaxID=2756 RepID=A0A1D2LPD5_BROTH|nr:ABC transporter ATP-binding protein [Brochothrix thermosphacta]ATH84708.1 ABC transporter ATP-binding protein [Brochothrix thermosphacta]MPQ27760.1 ATP-binding cassette domain-containing protein [Brochothrix thermosphacta]ODJ47859.1 ABC transporter ATP-binding protein [Brochothrix thermosphacta]ODJ61188.1 ABC transporter ATP-binding protein [Brochothrix thermosphacta]
MKEGRLMIEIKNLTIPFVDKQINMTISKGYNLLVGDNGVGKTLLLDYISGLKKTKGNCIFGNEKIIYINQHIYFSDRLSGMDFLKFSYGIDDNKNISSFFDLSDNIIERNDLNNLLKKQWGMLSGGEKRFLYVIILLSLDKDWYILDEPFASIDKKRKLLLYKLINVKLAEGKGIILTTHEESEEVLSAIDTILEMG